jgi:hypothetical protein
MPPTLHADLTTSDKMMTLVRNGSPQAARQLSKNHGILTIDAVLCDGMAHASALRP